MTEATNTPDAAPKKVKLTDEQKAANKAANEKAKAEKKAAADAAKPPKAAKIEKNGVSRPSTGVTLKVWEAADAVSAKNRRPAERAEVAKELEGQVEVGTIHTQYGRWRKFHGLVETKEQRQVRLNAKKEETKAKREAEKAKTAQAREAEKAEKAKQKEAEKQKKADEKKAKAAAKAPVAETAAPAPTAAPADEQMSPTDAAE